MSGDGQQQLQKAVYDALTAALATAGPAGAPVPGYDDPVPQDASFPYWAFGASETSEFDTTTELGQEHVLEIHTFWRNDDAGKKQIQALQKKVYDAIHNVSLTLAAGAALVFLFQDFSTVFTDPDGVTQHGIQRFRAATTEA